MSKLARARMEGALGVLLAVISVTTVLVPDWIELITDLEPDGGSGSLEWVLVGAIGVLALAAALLCRRDYAQWRRLQQEAS